MKSALILEKKNRFIYFYSIKRNLFPNNNRLSNCPFGKQKKKKIIRWFIRNNKSETHKTLILIKENQRKQIKFVGGQNKKCNEFRVFSTDIALNNLYVWNMNISFVCVRLRSTNHYLIFRNGFQQSRLIFCAFNCLSHELI